MLHYTGHPLLDVGVATLVAFAGKRQPEELIEADLEAAADYMAANYNILPLRSFLTVVFPNADGFTQPAYFKQPEAQRLYAERVLYSFRSGTPIQETVDIFTGLPVVDVPFDAKGEATPGRTDRRHIPLQTAVGVINFHPEGDPGLPVSGPTLLAFQALPLGSAKCGGRLLAVHSDNDEILLYFASSFLEENRRTIHTAQQTGEPKMPEASLKYRTLLIETLLKAREKQWEAQRAEAPFTITAYHLSNSGQGPDLDIYHLPSQVILYIKEMYRAEPRPIWDRVVRAGWERPKLKRGQAEPPADYRPSRNWVYEDLFQVANDPNRYAPRFIRTYFLRKAWRYARQDETDPRGGYATSTEAALISWRLVEPFLRRILNMQAERINHIRDLGDALATYVRAENDRRFFRDFYVLGRYDHLRVALLKANNRQVQRGRPPLLTLDGYLTVFEEGEQLARVDWRLARDLVLIRMIEQLYADGWLGRNEDIVAEAAAEIDQETNEE